MTSPATTRLAKLLHKQGRTGAWLARQVGTNISQVSRWRNGVNTPTHAYQRRIAKALGVQIEDLWPAKETK